MRHLLRNAAFLGAVCSATAFAQLGTPVLKTGDPLPGAPGFTATFVTKTATNHVGGWAVRVNATNGSSTNSYVWGTPDGVAPPTVLFVNGTYAGYEQVFIDQVFDLGNGGEVIYTATVVDTSTGVTGIDSLWVDETPVYVEGEPVAGFPGHSWLSASDPLATGSGQPFWYGRFENDITGDISRSVFLGPSQVPLLFGGTTIPNMPLPLDIDLPVVIKYGASGEGSHWLVRGNLEGSSDAVIIMDGAGLLVGGLLVQDNQPLSTSSGAAPGDTWTTFDEMGASEAGNWFLTGRSSLAGELMLVDGVIRHEQGDLVDGETLGGIIQGVVMNDDGDLAYNWRVASPDGGTSAWVNDDMLIEDGGPIDLDGDGVPEPGATITRILGLNMSLGDRLPDGSLDVLIHMDVDTMGTSTVTDDLDVLFVVRYRETFVDVGSALAGASGLPHFQVTGFLQGDDPITMTLQNALPSGTTNLVVGLSTINAPFKGGVLVPSPDILLPGLPLTADGSLVFEATWPSGVPSGVTLAFQHWIADAAGPVGFAASNAVVGTTP